MINLKFEAEEGETEFKKHNSSYIKLELTESGNIAWRYFNMFEVKQIRNFLTEILEENGNNNS